ncbi:DUF58 domain-containing protein [Luteimicrobium sp. NPDC057192]|uniref:DUF58 domain-containing protein n=1 Tax=Luteimicrobium sp. NPDC057192 TaxID=3346042 RepID=UPI00363A7F30
MARARTTRVRLTDRGIVLAVGGGILALAGVGLHLPDVVAIGVAPLVAVAAAALWMRVVGVDRGRTALTTTRRVLPNPVVRGQVTEARLAVRPAHLSSAATAQLARTRVAENVSTQLSHRPPRGTQRTGAEEIVVTYQLHPSARGRWLLGPASATVEDPFGLVRTVQPFGSTTTVTVWPSTYPLPVRAARSLAVASDAASGSRAASPDDAVLREYVAGDDPRRIHWASAARRGELMVRSDEGAGLPPVTVLFDRGLLPTRDATKAWDHVRPAERGEWAVECAASIAVSLVEAGHAGRIVGTSSDGAVAAVPHVPGGRGEGRSGILEQAVDLTGLRDGAEADRAVAATAAALRVHRHADELTFAVLRPQSGTAQHALAHLGGEGDHAAVVVVDRSSSQAQHRAAQDTVAALRAAGWRALAVVEGSGLEATWLNLVQEAAWS